MNLLRSALEEGRKEWNTVVFLSYAFDWVLLGVGVGVGYVLGEITPNKRPFALDDHSIAFPYFSKDTVPGWLLLFCSAAIPVIIIALISLALAPRGIRGAQTVEVWKLKLWEVHVGWMGLALSLISTWIITNGLKNMFGKPRPDMLGRCRPDYANLERYLMGERSPGRDDYLLVSADICTNPDKGTLDDAFRAFPSGHSSISAAGLMYLSLFLFAKLTITTPFLIFSGPDTSFLHAPTTTPGISRPEKAPSPCVSIPAQPRISAKPLYLLLISVIPFFAAIFIGSSRWFDYRHQGVDIVSGFLIGGAAALFSFHYYHVSLASFRDGGRAWGPRRGRGFWGKVQGARERGWV
ncbi:phosphatidic acid phosphatase type 2/haloperoxidase [Cercophora newfieldiana]|uniref:Phosphatidic acid phosphatase type 2/haloperoxidase n=1 Tax=Cercophora newfieldiana TaxID=92897 RepID=A0AA39YPB6_9PEZI|nr:phosphatidic acid phosphatase type 2/haloperoxidase [Cercophora newfieldiana]